MLTLALLALTAFAAGVTGAWSPCGFSMVETIAGAAGREGAAARRSVRASCATFALGAVLGGALTFGLLAAVGALLGGGGDTAVAVAAGLALAAAVADALGLRVLPQIRRQVPEPWRRVLPLPLAAALYGVLLGLGFTTFVLAFAVWALAGIAVALGSIGGGLAIGVAFGVGRALPVVLLAPRHDERGEALATRMAEEPALLRRLRRADAALLLASALALALGGTAATADGATRAAATPGAATGVTARTGVTATPGAAATTVAATPGATAAARKTRTIANGATDPAVSAPALLWRTPGGDATLRLPDGDVALPGGLTALGGPHLARVSGATIEITAWAAGGGLVASVAAGARVTQLAVSSSRVVWVTGDADGGQTLFATALANPAATPLAHTGPRARLGRPALAGDRLAYAISSPHGSRIVLRDLAAGTARVVRRSARTQLAQPALRHDRLLYVEARACDQRLRLAPLRPSGRVGRARTLLRIGGTARRDAGHEHHHTTQGSEPTRCPHGTPHRSARTLWSTALGGRAAYVTLLRAGTSAGRARATLVSVPL